MKKLKYLFGLLLLMVVNVGLYANCINSCGSINDGKCNVDTVSCVKETDPTLANCNRLDSTTSGGVHCPPT